MSLPGYASGNISAVRSENPPLAFATRYEAAVSWSSRIRKCLLNSVKVRVRILFPREAMCRQPEALFGDVFRVLAFQSTSHLVESVDSDLQVG